MLSTALIPDVPLNSTDLPLSIKIRGGIPVFIWGRNTKSIEHCSLAGNLVSQEAEAPSSLGKMMARKPVPQWSHGSEGFEVCRIKGRGSSLDGGWRETKSCYNCHGNCWAPREEARTSPGSLNGLLIGNESNQSVWPARYIWEHGRTLFKQQQNTGIGERYWWKMSLK